MPVVACFLIWRLRLAARFRSWAARASPRLFVQCLLFVPLLAVMLALVGFPLDYYAGFVLEHWFDLSTESLASWLADWAKSLALTVMVAVPVVWGFYRLVRRSPQRWWMGVWLASIPVVLAFLAAGPYVVEPLFFKFTPLERTHPELTARVEKMLLQAGLDIPPSRIFEMNASAKTRALDAYVSGLGPTQRVVIWDNTLRTRDDDQTLLVLAHETGHYVLHHVLKVAAWIELWMLPVSFLGFWTIGRIVGRRGGGSGLESVGNLASCPVVLLVFTVLWFLSLPVINGISRHYERQADQFGLELSAGVVPQPGLAEAHSLQALGERDLEDPEPSRIIVFWLYTHPPIEERIRSAVRGGL